MKQGLTYISERDSFWVYSDIDRKTQALQPLSMYMPLCKIRRGTPVSIAVEKDLEDYAKILSTRSTSTAKSKEESFKNYFKQSRHSFIVPTNPRRHTHSIGLALEYSTGFTADSLNPATEVATVYSGKLPSLVHVVANGAMRINPFYEKKAGYVTNVDMTQNYVPNFLSNYSKNIGKTIYVKGYNGSNDFREDDGNSEFLTLDEKEAYFAYNNIIQIGHVADAWLSTDTKKESGVCIEVQIEGDNRGPIDNTQFEAVLGETVNISKSDPIRVFAIGCETNQQFKFSYIFDADAFTAAYNAGKDGERDFGFIALQKQDGSTTLLSICNTHTKQLNRNAYSDEDLAFLALADVYSEATGSVGLVYSDSSTGYFTKPSSDIAGTLKTKLKSWLFDTLPGGSKVEVLKDRTIFTANNFGGYYDVYVSSNARRFFKEHKVICRGSTENRGKAVLADIRDANRQSILGVYYGPIEKDAITLAKDQNAIFMKVGMIRTETYDFGNRIGVGNKFYLSTNGRVVGTPTIWAESQCEVGAVQYSDKVLIDVQDPRKCFDGTLPIGYLKPCYNNVPDPYFFRADGTTPHSKKDYPLLYDYLSHLYSETDLHYDDENFVVPKITFEFANSNTPGVTSTAATADGMRGYVLAQIKYARNDEYAEQIRPEPFKIFHGHTKIEGGVLGCLDHYSNNENRVDVRAVGNKFDITDLAVYGLMADFDNSGIFTPSLDLFDIKMFADFNPAHELGSTETSNLSEPQWTEVRPGFHLFNSTDYYGFEWTIETEEENGTKRYYLKMIDNVVDPKNENSGKGYEDSVLGPCFQVNPFSPPEPLTRRPVKIVVVRKERSARLFNIEGVLNEKKKELSTQLKYVNDSNNTVAYETFTSSNKASQVTHDILDNTTHTEVFSTTVNGKVYKIKHVYDFQNNKISVYTNSGNGDTWQPAKIESQNNGSTIRIKNVYQEFLPHTAFRNASSNASTLSDLDTIIHTADSTEKKDGAHYPSNKTSSTPVLKENALEALSLIPTARYMYKAEDRGNSNMKKFFGIIIERVGEVKQKLAESDRLVANLPVSEIYNKEYFFNKEELDSMQEYLNSLTNAGETTVNVLSSLGVLMQAAKETYERLIKLEASTFGADAEHLPGRTEIDSNKIPEYATQDPTYYGLNRLVRALCAEIFQQADPSNLVIGADGSINKSDSANFSRLDDLDVNVKGQRTSLVGTKGSQDFDIQLNQALGATYPLSNLTRQKAYNASYKVTVSATMTQENLDKAYVLKTTQTINGKSYKVYDLKNGYSCDDPRYRSLFIEA